MLGNARKNLILALVVVLAVGLVAYAQTGQKPKPAGVPSPPNEKLDLTGIADFFRINPANQQEWFYKMVEIRRNLMPPGPKEMIRLANLLGLTEEQKQSIKPHQRAAATIYVNQQPVHRMLINWDAITIIGAMFSYNENALNFQPRQHIPGTGGNA